MAARRDVQCVSQLCREHRLTIVFAFCIIQRMQRSYLSLPDVSSQQEVFLVTSSPPLKGQGFLLHRSGYPVSRQALPLSPRVTIRD